MILIVGAATALVMLNPLGVYPFYYAVIVAGAAYRWHVGIVPVSITTVLAVVTWAAASSDSLSFQTALVTALFGGGAITARRLSPRLFPSSEGPPSRYRRQVSDSTEPTKAPTPYAVLDVDGVLADVQHRLHHLESHPKDWDAFFGDAPRDPLLEEGLEVALDLAREHEIVYLTGRPERCRDATKAWLDKYRFPPGQIIMRSDTDRRPARVMKIAELNGLRKRGRVALLIDDDEQVVAAAEGRGFVVRHATWMYREQHEEQALSTAQETDGRT